MLFNSIDFALFLPVVFVIYWFVVRKNLQLQNLFVVLASYVFYGWWDWRFLSLIAMSTLVDYAIGITLEKEERINRRKILLGVSILVNLGFLGFFKYYGFFIENFSSMFTFFGMDISTRSLDIILPVGISFYTFQTLSYTIDVYKRRMTATQDLTAFAAFVSFFPQLVAGPIERASNLLPQFQRERSFDLIAAVDGLRQMLWGLVKKVVIADNCAVLVDQIFDNSADMNGSTLVLGALLFTFQIYGDFSGYSDIAIGASRLFGFDLMKNFAFPYFSRDIAEFWRRWHISLSTWFRDYLYIPLGGSRGGKLRSVRNVLIIFLVSGFWHGANWTFIVWGAMHAAFFLPILLAQRNRSHMEIVAHDRRLPSVKEGVLMLRTFSLVVLSWVVFRAENIAHAIDYYAGIFNASLFTLPMISAKAEILLIIGFVVVEWFGRRWEYGLAQVASVKHRWVRWGVYMVLLFLVFAFHGKEQAFIYFQF